MKDTFLILPIATIYKHGLNFKTKSSLHLRIPDLNIPLKIIPLALEVVIYVQTSLYVVIDLLAQSLQTNISLKENLITI